MTTKIEWTDASWSPVIGCTPISRGCDNCYARRMARRLKAMGQARYRDGFAVRTQPDRLEEPLRWRKPRMVFVCSMGDLFHNDVPTEYIHEVFGTIRRAHRHTFQVLTKRPRRAKLICSILETVGGMPDNVWVGTTVENSWQRKRIKELRQTGAKVRFLSCEPLLEDLGRLDLDGIHWVIVGGESGPGARPMDPDWVRDIRDQCIRAGVAFFFKQWGGVNKKKAGRVLDGRTWDEMPGEASR